MDDHSTYCGDHFTMYVSQIIMFYILNLALYVNDISIKLEEKKILRLKQKGKKRRRVRQEPCKWGRGTDSEGWREGFPGGAVVKNPPANAGDTGSSPGPGRSHMPRSN